jgi:hypothetical protein
MSRRMDWSRTRWENRYFQVVGDAPDTFGPWKPAKPRRPLPLVKQPFRLKAGDAVYARRWGSGRVLEIGPDGLVTVLFQGRFRREVRYEEIRP